MWAELLKPCVCMLVLMGIPIYIHRLAYRSRSFQKPVVDLPKVEGRLLEG